MGFVTVRGTRRAVQSKLLFTARGLLLTRSMTPGSRQLRGTLHPATVSMENAPLQVQKMIRKEPSWPPDTGSQNAAVGVLLSDLGPRDTGSLGSWDGLEVLGILGGLGSWEIRG